MGFSPGSLILTARKVVCDYDSDRFALSSAQVDIGDIVFVRETSAFWVISNPAALNSDAGYVSAIGGGGGTVTSIGLSMPSGFSVGGSPVTGSGTIAVTTALNGIVKASGGAFSVITIGSGLSFDGTTLTATGGAGTPGGSNLQVQWNDNGSFGADADLQYDSGTLYIGDPSSSNNGTLQVGGGSGGTATIQNGNGVMNIVGASGMALKQSSTTYISISSGIKFDQLTSNGLLTTSGSNGSVSVTVPAANVLTFLATPSSANLASAMTDETGSGLLVFATSPSFTTNFTLANGTGPTTSSVAQVAFDTNAWAGSRGAIQVHDGTAVTYVVAVLQSDTPSNGQVPTWNTGGTITWETPSGAANAVTAASAAGGAGLLWVSDGADRTAVATDTIAAATITTATVEELLIADTDQSHGLSIVVGSDLSADRTLTFTTGDSNRTVTISGDITLPAGTAAVIGSSNSWADGVKQTFNPNGTNAGINVGAQAGDPSSLADGDVWYNSSANELKARINGSSVALGAGGGAVSSVSLGRGAGTVSPTTGDVLINFPITPERALRMIQSPASGTTITAIGGMSTAVDGTAGAVAGTATTPVAQDADTAATTDSDAGPNEGTTMAYFGHYPTYSFRAKLDSFAAGVLRCMIGAGSGNILANDVSNGIDYVAFRYSTSAGDTNWMCMTNDGGTAPAAVSSGVAADGNWHTFTIETSASSVKFWIDGVLRHTASTDLPRTSEISRAKCQVRTLENVSKTISWARIGYTHAV